LNGYIHGSLAIGGGQALSLSKLELFAVTTALKALVTSLGDFPLDPDSGKAWLWSGAGERLIWVSEPASQDVSPAVQDNMPASGIPSFLRSFIPLLDLPAPDREPVRVQQLTFGAQPGKSIYTCLCRHVPLADGGYGLLAVAIGAPARSLAAMQEPHIHDAVPQQPATLPVQPQEEQPVPARLSDPPPEPAEPLPPLTAPTTTYPADIASGIEVPTTVMPPAMAAVVPTTSGAAPSSLAPFAQSLPSPTWLGRAVEQRRPLRFVWQTDKDGRFVHLSRELMDAVGLGKTIQIGARWEDVVSSLGLTEAESVANGLASGETWSAAPVLWPVDGSSLSIPVEMAGIKVMEQGAFAGFRGYGIARIERAVAGAASAAEAVAKDDPPETEQAEDRFGPAAMRVLRRPTKPLTIVGDTASPEPPVIVTSPLAAPVSDEVAITPQAATTGAPATIENAPSSLTTTEREAFREIARALGAPDTPAVDHPKPRMRMRTKSKTLDALRQDLLNLTPGQATQGPDNAASDDQPLAPVIPYDALQARREFKLRQEPITAAAPFIVDKAPVGFLVMQDGRAVFANRYLLDMVGFSDLETFLREGGANRLFGVSPSEASSAHGHFPISTQAGETLMVDATVQAITWDDAPATLTSIRRATAVSPASTDTRMKTIELDLISARAELNELRSVLDTATDGVILMDAKGQILSVNRSAEALFGFDQKEIVGESLTILLEPESHLAALDYLEGLKTNGVKSILNDGREVKGRERNGGAIPLFMTIGRIGEKSGSARFCAVLRDVTHWKKVESDLLDAKRNAEVSSDNKTDFLAKISHEIRTPLNAIIGFSEVMMTEGFGPIGNERYRQYAKDIHDSGGHIISLVNDLLDLSKVAAGKLELSFGSVDINAIVAASVAMVQPQANAGKVIMRSQLAPRLPPIVADERSIRQIMLNLLSNAAKFTDAGGQVVASTSLTDKGEVVIRVRDTGIGMSPDEVKRAMEPFRQIPGPKSSGGTGLGLPLTKALVEANRAGFSMSSEPSKGTLVEVLFPSTRVLAE
jgi:PAS domain S-box-containing protein